MNSDADALGLFAGLQIQAFSFWFEKDQLMGYKWL